MDERDLVAEVKPGRPRSRIRRASRSHVIAPTDPETAFADRPTREIVVPSASRPTRLLTEPSTARSGVAPLPGNFADRVTVPRLAPMTSEARRSVELQPHQSVIAPLPAPTHREEIAPPAVTLRQMRIGAIGFALGFAAAMAFASFVHRSRDVKPPSMTAVGVAR